MGAHIIVVDDDLLVGSLTMELLQAAGFETELIQDSKQVLAAVKEQLPALVLLDILMPGIVGMALLHKIKSDPDCKTVKVAIVSGKSFAADKERAVKIGADAFISKPYELDTFIPKIRDILGPEAAQAPTSTPRPKPVQPLPEKLQATFWGTRSQGIAGTSLYGKKTPCVALEFNNNLLIFDAGSGISDLAAEVLKAGGPKTLWIFLTHFHQAHIEGLGAFPIAHTPGYTINISGANDPEISLQGMVADVFKKAPGNEGLAANIELYELLEETYEIMPEVKLTAFYANHPSTTLGFKLEAGGRKFVYCPDSEIYGESVTALQDYDEKLGGICAGADLLIHDGRYVESDYQKHKNEGHSAFINTIAFAARNNIKKLLLIHQDAQYSDEQLAKMEEEANRFIASKNHALECAVAREGMKVLI